jgi:hypothetical protein
MFSRVTSIEPGYRSSIPDKNTYMFLVFTFNPGSGIHPAFCRMRTREPLRAIQQSEHEDELSLPTSAKVKYAWRCLWHGA